MKKVLKNLTQGYNFIDLIFVVLFAVGFAIFCGSLNVPFFPAVCGVLPILCVMTACKKTISGFALSGLFYVFYAVFLFKFSLLGSFIGILLFQIPILVLNIIMLAENKVKGDSNFNKWDYLTIGLCLLLASFPFYLLLIQIGSNYVLLQTLTFLAVFVMSFLKVKNVKWAKYLNLIVIALELTVFVLFIIDLELSTATFAFGNLLAFIYKIITLINQRKPKQIE